MKLVLFKVGDSGNTNALRFPNFQMCARHVSTSDSDRGCWRGERNGLSRYQPSSSTAAVVVKPIINNASLTKAFLPSTINEGSTSTLTFNITENTKNDGVDNTVSFTDTLRSGLVIATPANVQNTCTGGTITANDGGNTISVAGTVLGNGTPSCPISVDVTAATVGSYLNGAADISGLAGIETSAMTDQTLTVKEPCTPGEVVAGAFRIIRIGDIDGFGFGDGAGLTAAYGKPVNRDGKGILTTEDFLPDYNGDGKISNRNVGDSFDKRTDAEVEGTYTTGIGMTDTGSKGSDYTDLSLAKSFGHQDSPTYGRPFPDGNPKELPNQPGFKFSFKVAKGKLVENAPLFLNVMLGDYDVQPAQVIMKSANGDTVTLDLEASRKGKKDGVIQAAFVPLKFAQVFSDGDANGEAGYWLGHLEVDFNAPEEPFLAFDFVEIGTEQIALIPCPGN